MHILQEEWCRNGSAVLKKALLLIALSVCFFNLNAQETNNRRILIEAGVLPVSSDSENLEFFINIEPKVKVVENIFIGLRFGVALNTNLFENNDVFIFSIDDKSDNGVVSFVPNLDYYLNDFRLKERVIRPYVGLGLGYYLSSDIDVAQVDMMDFSEDVSEVSINKRIGLLGRGGFESGRLRLGLEYTLMPKAAIEMPDGTVAGTVDSRYLGLSVGLVIGSGQSLKQL